MLKRKVSIKRHADSQLGRVDNRVKTRKIEICALQTPFHRGTDHQVRT